MIECNHIVDSLDFTVESVAALGLNTMRLELLDAIQELERCKCRFTCTRT